MPFFQSVLNLGEIKVGAIYKFPPTTGSRKAEKSLEESHSFFKKLIWVVCLCVSMCFRSLPPIYSHIGILNFKKIWLTYSCTEFGRESSRTGPFSGSVRLKSKVILTESRKSCLSCRLKHSVFCHWYHICWMFWPCYGFLLLPLWVRLTGTFLCTWSDIWSHQAFASLERDCLLPW